MKLILVLALTLLLQGCFFVWIPGSVISKLTGGEASHDWNACVAESLAYQGATFWRPDTAQSGTVEKVFGRSSRCPNATQPILIEAKYGSQ